MRKPGDLFYKNLLAIVLPIACQNLMSALVSASDAIMLGMLNQASLSAVSLATQIQFVPELVHHGPDHRHHHPGGPVLGEGRRAGGGADTGLATKLSVIVSAVFFAAAFWVPDRLMGIFTNDRVLIAYGAQYLKTVSWSYLLASVSQIYLCIMKNSGRTLRSTVYSVIAMVLNIGLNLIFIFGLLGLPARGIVGAAMATVIARLVELVLTLMENGKKDRVRLRWANIVDTEDRLKRDFWQYTGPVLANELVWGCGFTMFTVIMGHLGSDAVAANSYANIVKNLISCFCLGIGTGSGIIIGNELGNGELAKARENGGRLCRFAIGSGVLSGVVILLLSPFILAHVSHLSAAAQGYLRVMLIICAYYMIGKAVNSTTVAGIFCAGGDTRFGFLCDTVTMWVLIIPVGMVAAFILHLPVLVVYFLPEPGRVRQAAGGLSSL